MLWGGHLTAGTGLKSEKAESGKYRKVHEENLLLDFSF